MTSHLSSTPPPYIPDPPQLTYTPISSGARFAHWQDLPGGRPIQYLITLSLCSCLFHTRRGQGKVGLWKEREGWLWKKGDSVCQEAFSGGRKSAGAEVPVRRSVSVNVTDAVTQSISDDVAMSSNKSGTAFSSRLMVCPISHISHT
jgi:hypothetical protein